MDKTDSTRSAVSSGRGPDASSRSDFVGIWKLRDGPEGREFIRDRSYFAYWRAAADVERIPPKGQRKRIAFLGESAARGLYYDPVFTPAKVLQAILDQGGTACEVVDLSVTAIRPRQLGGLIRQLPALQPDAIVLFAGNNWHWEFDNDNAPPEEVRALAAAFRAGVGAYQREVERRLVGGAAGRILGTLAETAKGLGIPAVIVVPEFNLADWRDHLVPPLLRPGESAAEFPVAKDAVGGLPYWSCPRCLSSTQAILRSAPEKFGMTVVDLPALFAREGKTPGRKHFLDYCHMTAFGIGTAMQAVAEAVGGVLSPPASRRAAAIAIPEPDPAVAAAAQVLAAVHNSILGQPAEVVVHHCREGLRLDPGVEALLRALLVARVTDIPDWLDRDLARACSLPNARRHAIRTILPSEGRHFPSNLLEHARAFLSEAGVASCREAIRLAVASARESGRLNLLDPRYQPANLHLRRAGYHEEKNRRTEFRFPCPPAGELSLRICLRAPHAAEPAALTTIACGGRTVWSGPVGRSWKKVEFKFQAGAAADGLAVLSVSWPDLPAFSAAAWQAAEESVDRGEAPDVYLTFGEIHSLVVEWQKSA